MNIYLNKPSITGQIHQFTINADDLFTFFTCGLCVVMAGGLFFRKPNLRNTLLAALLICTAYILFSSVLVTTKIITLIPFLTFTQIPFGYSISPILYLYFKTFTDDIRRLTKKEMLHFVPVAIAIAFVIPYILKSSSEKSIIINQMYNSITIFSLFVLSGTTFMIIYSVIIIVQIAKGYKDKNPVHRKIYRVFYILLIWIALCIVKVIGIHTNIEQYWRIVNTVFSIQIILIYFAMQKMPFLLSYATISIGQKKSTRQILGSLDADNLKKRFQ